MKLAGRLQRALYTLFLHLVLPLACLRLLWLGLRNRVSRRRWREHFGVVDTLEPGTPTICIHAVSVGEVLSTGPLIPRLREMYPGARFIVTTFTPTGAEMVGRRLDDDVRHLYFPWDLPWAVHRFLRCVRPGLMLIMETEIWPNFYAACHENRIPLVMVNARISPRSFAGYARFPRLVGDALACVDRVAAQTRMDAERFIRLGAPAGRVEVVGNLKFDIQVAQSVGEQGQALRRTFSNDRLIWVAASTHAGEEELVLAAHAAVLQVFPRSLLILAPRHPERFDQVAQQCDAAGFTTVRRSGGITPARDTQVFLLDTLGELLPYYASADVAFVGGSLVPAGGHNLLEPASLGLPLLTGPHTCNFTEVIDFLVAPGALRVVDDAAALAAQVRELLGDANLRHTMGEEARRVCATHRGAAERVVRLIVQAEQTRPGLTAPPAVLG